MVVDRFVVLEGDVAGHGERFLEDHGGHDGGTDGDVGSALEVGDAVGVSEEVDLGGTSDCGAGIEGMGVVNVVAEHGVSGEGDLESVCGGLEAVLLEGMGDGEITGFDVEGVEGLEEVVCGGGILGGGGDCSFEFGAVGDGEGFIFDHCADRFAVAPVFVCAEEEGEVEIESCFVPCAEFAFDHVFAYVFAAGALVGEFPVVDDSCTVCGDVGDPSGFEEADDDGGEAVFDGVCTEDEHSGLVVGAGGLEALDEFGDDFVGDGVEGFGKGVDLDVGLLYVYLVAAFR